MKRTCGLLVITWTLGSALVSADSAQAATELAKGKLLVAREGLSDPNFSKTVVLLLDYGDSGASGVVLNRPSPFRLEQLLSDKEWSAQAREPVYVGGPVAVTRALMLFTKGKNEAKGSPVIGAVHVGWDLELLERLVTDPQGGDRFRVFAGHAGWAAGQLDAEVERLGWYVFPATEAEIFSSGGEQLWEAFIRKTRTRTASLRPSPPDQGPPSPGE